METGITPMMQEATDALIGNLLASEAFIHYQQAQSCLNGDRQARALLEQLSQTQTSLREKQANGVVTQADVDGLRAIQEQVQRNNIIMDYAHTQQNAVNFLREINDEISQLLGINFASFANRATC
jgi:cell fate (sporulation/competence/biofilm development) regulator YlbF (YheA/YmcA/DUF963 family)